MEIKSTYRRTGRKCVYENVPLRPLQRVAAWLSGVRAAIATPPPKFYTHSVEVFPGDPRFDDPFALELVEHITSFELGGSSVQRRATPHLNP